MNVENKEALLKAARTVYLGYAALHFSKARRSSVNGTTNQSFFELCIAAIDDAEQKHGESIEVSTDRCTLTITPSVNASNSFQVQFKSKSTEIASSTSEIKEINGDQGYFDQDVIHLLQGQQITIERSSTGQYAIANKLNEHYKIGGLGKIDLYCTHLVTLYNIISKIESEDDISNLLVALATGSGKTYVQALWMLVLSLSGNHGVFAVPDKLISQFKKDLRRLLPDAYVTNLQLIENTTSDNIAENILAQLANDEVSTPGQIILAPSERLLDRHYSQLLAAKSERTFLSFDEQHLIMKTEVRRVRLLALSKQMLSMFLTATPNEETYRLSGRQPVAIMSSGQKEKAGQGQFPELYTLKARNIRDRNKLKTYRFWRGEFWQNVANGLLLRIMNSIDPDRSSAASTMVEELPFCIQKAPGGAVQMPAARKILCIIDDNEELVNLCYTLNGLKEEGERSRRRDVYSDGNVRLRRDITEFFVMPDVEETVVEADMKTKRTAVSKTLSQQSSHVKDTVVSQLQNRNLFQHLKHTILHNMMEYILMDITGLDEIAHNRLRKEDMREFKALVISKYQNIKSSEKRDEAYYRRKLIEEVGDGSNISKQISQQLVFLYQRFDHYNLTSNYSESSQALAGFISNNPLDQDTHFFKSTLLTNFPNFDTYANTYAMVAVMTGMTDAETPIPDSKPFSGLRETTDPLYDDKGMLLENTKKRQHSSLEILNDQTQETTFEPDLLSELTEEMCDQYFRLGFFGMYVSNKKTEGFNDAGLQTVVNITGQTPNPVTRVQAIGRDRGLDDTIVPAYFDCRSREQNPIFELDELKRDDYYPALFKANKRYHKIYLKRLGKNIGESVVAWIHQNLDDDRTMDPHRLKQQVLQYVNNALREINNQNDHNIKLSRIQLAKVIDYAMQEIAKTVARWRKPYRLSLTVRVIGSVLNFMSECYYSIKRVSPRWKLTYQSWGRRLQSLKKALGWNIEIVQNKVRAEDVYTKIIKRIHFKKIVAQMLPMAEFKNWLSHSTSSSAIETMISKHLGLYLKDGIKEKFVEHQESFLIPVILKMIDEPKREQVGQALSAHPKLISFFYLNRALLTKIFDGTDKDGRETLLNLLKKIPSLENLNIDDIVDYPSQVTALTEKLRADPLALFEEQPNAENEVRFLKQLATSVANYMVDESQSGFLRHLTALMTYPNAQRVRAALQQKTCDERHMFINELMQSMQRNGEQQLPVEKILTELSKFLAPTEFKLLDADAKNLHEEFEQWQQQAQANPVAQLNTEILTELTTVFKEELLPVLVNYYPVGRREELLKQAQNNQNLKPWLIEQWQKLSNFMINKNSQGLADFVFKSLVVEPDELPRSKDLTACEAEIKSLVDSEIAKNSSMGLTNVMGFFGAVASNRHPMESPLKNFLTRDEFLNAISVLFPYPQWLELKSELCQENSPLLHNVVQQIINQVKSGADFELSPEQVLSWINEGREIPYQTSQKSVEQVKEKVAAIQKKISNDPRAYLNSAVKDKYIQATRDKLLPLLACFIREDSRKQQFLEMKLEDQALFKFITENEDHFKTMVSTEDGDEAIAKALILINQLKPQNEEPLTSGDLIEPREHAQQTLQSTKQECQAIAWKAFLTNSEFDDLIKLMLTDEDHLKLKTHLTDSLQLDAFIKKLIDNNVDPFKQQPQDVLNSSMRIVRATPGLTHVRTIESRSKDFEEFHQSMEKKEHAVFENEKVAELIAKQFIPIFSNKNFIKGIDRLIGFLNKKDLIAIFQSWGTASNTAKEQAEQLLRFIQLIKHQNWTELTKEFFTSSEAGQSAFNFEGLAVKKMLDRINDLIDEVLDCHCWYNQHNKKGMSVEQSSPPKLIADSASLREIRVSSSRSFISHFSRKIFYLQGIRNGLKAGGEVSAESNQHLIKLLQRVNTHMLRPLRRRTNASILVRLFVNGGHWIESAIKAVGYGLLNSCKRVGNLLSRSKFKVSVKNPDSQDFRASTLSFITKLRKLKPLTEEDVERPQCEPDVVTQLDHFVATGSPVIGSYTLFAVKKSSNAQDDSVQVDFDEKGDEECRISQQAWS